MTIPIEEIPIEELRTDRIESPNDIIVCERALAHGISEYSGGSTERRLKVNRGIVNLIDVELERRGETP